ncbi:MAG: Uma2 family endonuclease, partial [Rudanella sp.]|nr:Uma2 family endonuclease [Rudanella sp.]
MIAEIETAHYQFTVGEYHRMGKAGIFTEDTEVELLNGQIYTMSPVGRKHAACVKRINNLFSKRLSDQAVISIQDSIILNDYSEPEPDIALLAPRDDFYEARLP